MSTLIRVRASMELCGEARDVPEARELCVNSGPDVVVVGLALRKGWGLDLVTDLPRLRTGVRILAIAEWPDERLLLRALRAGALGLGTMGDSAEEFLEGLGNVRDGEIWASRAVHRTLLGALRVKHDLRGGDGLERLSNRELGVFELLGGGFGPTRIAIELGLAVKTIETHLARIQLKLGLE